MLINGTRKHIWCHATAPAVRSEYTSISMGEMLTFLQMRNSTQLPVVAIAVLHVLCVRESLEMITRNNVQTWLHRMATGICPIYSSHRIKCTQPQYFLPYSFYLMVVAYQSYANGDLQFSGNVQSVELDGECTGQECQTGTGVTLPPTPPPPTGGGGK